MNVQVIADADGNLLRIFGAIGGSIHDTTAARIRQLPRLLRKHGLFALGDTGYQGPGHDLVVTSHRGKTSRSIRKRTTASTPGRTGPVSAS